MTYPPFRAEAFLSLVFTSLAAGSISSNSLGNGSLGNNPGGIQASNICPGSAYYNGEVNGNIDGWTINFGYAVSDSFTLSAATTVTGVAYGVREFPGDAGGSIDWTVLTGGPDPTAGGTVVASGHVGALSFRDLGINEFGYDIQVDSFSLSQALGAGTYFLELQNAAVASGDPVYWDENHGPLGNGTGSVAWDSGVGYLTPGAENGACQVTQGYCSESFAIYGSGSGVPEPGTLALGGLGLLLLGGAVTRKRP